MVSRPLAAFTAFVPQSVGLQSAVPRPVDLQPYLDLLKQYWGYDSFRGIQAEIIGSIAQGRDTLGLMPTGGGKSITFQVPALAMDGVCIVVSPLIALMKDQVYNLRRRGIKATAIYSGMTQQEIIVALENCILGDYKLLYVSPERVDTALFRAKLRRIRVSMVAVDESHCISQWGYDFRPSFLKLAELRDLLPPNVPFLALTASATPKVVKDIQQKLRFRRENVFRMSFLRRNLCYVVRHTVDKDRELLHILRHTTGSAIVYVRSRRATHTIAAELCKQGISADSYHAGLDNATRDKRQKDWTADRTRVIVATNAFGMGIDKPDVRLVVHIDPPDSPEAYYQEAGRAGRDGQQAYAVLLYQKDDQLQMSRRISAQFPDRDYIKKVYEDLQFYYQMAMGDGLGCIKLFDIEDFCRKFRHYPARAHASLRLLTLAGYLEYIEEPESASRLMFTVRRDELYRLHGLSEQADRLIRTVLRLYTGLFAEYAFVNEKTIAVHSGLDHEQVYDQLLNLSRQRIIHYIPQSALPRIVYRRERVELDDLKIPACVYEDRLERYTQRARAMVEYATDSETCRSRLLLRYFGERHSGNCGICDTCLRLHLKPGEEPSISVTDGRPETDLSPQEPPTLEELRQRILTLATQKPIDLNTLAYSLNVSKDTFIALLHKMADEGEISIVDGLLTVGRA